VTSYRWVGSIGSGQTATFNPSQTAGPLAPGETLVRSRIWINAAGYSPAFDAFAAVAFPFALVLSNTAAGPQWDPYSQWVTPESGVVMWSGMVPLYGNVVVPGITPVQYASQSQVEVDGWNTQAQRRNSNAVDQYIWLTGQMDPGVTDGQVFTSLALRCLIATP
jgi:hypothetical protein